MLLRMEHITKRFHGTPALNDVTFSIEAGEIHGLVGENGAGKSTLIKLLTGVYRMEEGTILWNGAAVSLPSSRESRALGIDVIHQDRTLVPTFSCVENAYLGRDYPTRLGRVDWKAMERRVRETAEKLGVELELSKTAAELSPPQRTELEIVRAMMHDCRLLILDEPTAALTDKEAERLFRLIGSLREGGTAVLYVSHRLDEIFRLTDRVTVLRNGTLAATEPTASLTREKLVALMSDSLPPVRASGSRTFGPVLLEAENLSSRDGRVRSGTLSVRAGEILGVFGLGGSGRTELMECIYGCRPLRNGRVALNGTELAVPSPAGSIRNGMVLICEDRRGKALAGNLSVRDNILLSAIDRFARGGVLREKAGDAAAEELIHRLNIRLTDSGQRIAELSGGNQQKAVFARALLTEPKVFLCDEPTQAVDVGARSEIHRLLRQRAEDGCGIVFVSSDLQELLEVADSIQIVSRGRTLKRLENRDLTARQVLDLCYRAEERREQA